MDEREVRAGEILFREGEPSDSVYLILGGEGALEEAGVAMAEAGALRLLPGSPAVESQIGQNGLEVKALPFRVGRRALPGEPARIDPAELSLQAGETFHLAAQHFAIEDREGHLVVRDLGSALGTLINETRIAEFEEGLVAPLRIGANEIQTGGAESRFRFTPLVKRR